MKNQKLQIPKIYDHRRGLHQRATAVVVALATLLSLAALDRHMRHALKEATVQRGLALHDVLERENETTRLPVKFDDGLRLPTTSGA